MKYVNLKDVDMSTLVVPRTGEKQILISPRGGMLAKHPQSTPCKINGLYFPSLGVAADYFKVDRKTIFRFLESGRTDGFAPNPYRNRKAVKVNGVIYKSLTDAAKSIGIAKDQLATCIHYKSHAKKMGLDIKLMDPAAEIYDPVAQRRRRTKIVREKYRDQCLLYLNAMGRQNVDDTALVSAINTIKRHMGVAIRPMRRSRAKVKSPE